MAPDDLERDDLDARLTADGAAWQAETDRGSHDDPDALLPRQAGVRSPAPSTGRGRVLLVAAAVAALVLAIAVPVWLVRSHPQPSAAPSLVAEPACPSTDATLPADQGTARPAAGSLVRSDAPVAMLICEYPLPVVDGGTTGAPVSTGTVAHGSVRSSRTVTAGLSSVPDDLSRFPLSPQAECTAGWAAFGWGDGARVSGSGLLVALRYPTGVVWLADSTGGPASCAAASGSAGYSTGSYADLFLRALATGSWQPAELRSAGCPAVVDSTPFVGPDSVAVPAVDTGGRLVPDELPTAAVLCGYDTALTSGAQGVDDPIGLVQRRIDLRGDLSSLVAALRTAPVVDASTWSCPAPSVPVVPQLLGLTYGTGTARTTIWVDARLGAFCGLVTNGRETAQGGLAGQLQQALSGTSPWPGVDLVDLDLARTTVTTGPGSPPAALPSSPPTTG